MTPATCIEPGTEVQRCECGKVNERPIPVKAHTLGSLIAADPATCRATGTAAHYQCADCKKLFAADGAETTAEKLVLPIDPDNHDIRTVAAKEATCTEDGNEAYEYCARCDYTTYQKIPAGHDYVPEVTAPTCTEGGYTTYTCSRCGDNYQSDFTEAKGHTMVTDKAVSADCTHTGLTEGSHCSDCGVTIVKQEETEALGHSWGAGETTKYPTTEEEGETTYTCTRCGATKTEPIARLEKGSKGLLYEEEDDGTLCVSGIGTCTDLDLVIPAKHDGKAVTVIRKGAFEETAITSVTIPASVTIIGDYAFEACEHLKEVIFEEDSCLERICQTAFYGCTALTAIELPEGMKEIGNLVFYGCISLTSVTIPSSVTSIGAGAFACGAIDQETGEILVGALTEILVEEGSEGFKSAGGVLYSKDGAALIQYPAAKEEPFFWIPDEVTSIGAMAFSFCKDLTSVSIPAGVTEIGVAAFAGTGLISTGIPAGITAIQDGTFCMCEDLISVAIPDGVTSIGTEAFALCPALTTVSIPKSVTRIGNYAFSDCDALEAVYYAGSAADAEKISFGEMDDLFFSVWYCYSETVPTEEGQYWYYAEGGEIVTVIIEHTHSFVWETETEPSCEESGWRVGRCSCGETLWEETPALGHSWDDGAVTAATCTEGGHTTYTCTECGETYVGDETAPLDHDYSKATTAPTCTEQGYTTYTCTRCDHSYVSDFTDALGHDWDDGVVTEPTCTEGGFKKYTCQTCGETRVENEVEATGHDIVYVEAQAPTCSAEGCAAHYECTVCGAVYGEDMEEIEAADVLIPIDPDAHAWDEGIVTAPTCTEGGYTTYTCTNEGCIASYTDDETPAAHTLSLVEAQAATCTTKGHTAHYACAHCDVVYDEDMNETTVEAITIAIDPAAHDWVEGVCSLCGEHAAPEGLSFVYLSETDSYAVSGYTGTETALVIPSIHNGKEVTSFSGESVFSGCTNLLSITIPKTMTEIGGLPLVCASAEQEILCGALTEILVEEGSEYYKSVDGVLYSIDGEKLVKYPEGKTAASFVVPEGVKRIYSGAFCLCLNLTSVTITEGVTCIYDTAFAACMGLVSITIPASVTMIHVDAFPLCTALTAVYYGGTAEDFAAMEIRGNNDPLLAATWYYYAEVKPEEAGNYWHYGEEGELLIWEYEHVWDTGVVTPPTCTEGGYTTYTCLLCGATHTGDEQAALGHEEVTDEAVAASCTESGLTEGRHCDRCGAVLVAQEVIPAGHSFGEWTTYIPATCTEGGEEHRACVNCSECDSRATPIDPDAHDWVNGVCSHCGEHEATEGLAFTYLSETDSYAVSGYTGTDTEVYIPSRYNHKEVTEIGCGAFTNKGMTSITIPATVTKILWDQDYLFYNRDLTSVYYDGNIEGWLALEDAFCLFGSSHILFSLYIGGELVEDLVIPEGVASISAGAFANCSSITSVSIPASATSIGSRSFSGCVSLTSITVANGNPVYHSEGNCLIETASKTLIAGCIASEIPSDGSVTTLGEDAFGRLFGLTTITIPASVESIGMEAFWACKDLETVVFGEGSRLEVIDNSAFANCESLTEIVLPESVTNLLGHVFQNCPALTSITIPANVTRIFSSMFYRCTSLVSITIPAGVTQIQYSAFEGCTALTAVYYGGTAEDFALMQINGNNNPISAATWYFYAETEQTAEGNYWHYNDNGEIVTQMVTAASEPEMTESYAAGRQNFYEVTGVRLPALSGVEAEDFPYTQGYHGYCFDLTGGESLSEDTFDALCDFLDEELSEWASDGATVEEDVRTVRYDSDERWIEVIWDAYNKAVYVNTDWKHTHSYGAWQTTAEATCTAAGTEMRSCSCGEEETRAVPALGHTWNDGVVTTAPTTEEEGVMTYTCTRCGATRKEAIARLGGEGGGENEESEGLVYTLLGDDTYEVTSAGTFSGTDLVIPEIYDGKAVTIIGDEAFANCAFLVSVTIPASIVEIGADAFYGCTALITASYGGTKEQYGNISNGGGNDALWDILDQSYSD